MKNKKEKIEKLTQEIQKIDKWVGQECDPDKCSNLCKLYLPYTPFCKVLEVFEKILLLRDCSNEQKLLNISKIYSDSIKKSIKEISELKASTPKNKDTPKLTR